ALTVECVDGRIGEPFPAPVCMCAGATLLHRQHAVEQQHTAVGPGGETAVAGAGDAEVALDFLEYVVQRWRHPHAGAHREAQAMRLAGTVVGILAGSLPAPRRTGCARTRRRSPA